jgi:hypothetical protein
MIIVRIILPTDGPSEQKTKFTFKSFWPMSLSKMSNILKNLILIVFHTYCYYLHWPCRSTLRCVFLVFIMMIKWISILLKWIGNNTLYHIMILRYFHDFLGMLLPSWSSVGEFRLGIHINLTSIRYLVTN